MIGSIGSIGSIASTRIAEVVYYWGTKDKHKEWKENQNCPFDPRKKK